MNTPLVSAICPTTNERRQYIPGVIKCFLDQDYQNKELVILDDGPEPVEDLIPIDARIRYARSDHKNNIGHKLNDLCALAAGEIIVRFDDDDHSEPGRITDQVARLQTSGKPLTGYYSILFLDERDGQVWRYVGHQRYACGTSFAFLKSLWEKTQFAPLAECSDNDYLRKVGPNALATVDGSAMIVARIHAGNSSPKRMIDAINAGRTNCENWTKVARETLPAGFRKAAGL